MGAGLFPEVVGGGPRHCPWVKAGPPRLMPLPVVPARLECPTSILHPRRSQ